MSESALYPAVKRFLEARGFVVKGEVCGCDVVGVRAGAEAAELAAELAGGLAGGLAGMVVITELKLGFSLELVLQGVERMACADEVWLAVAATRRGRDRDRRVRQLCRLLGVGLMAVHGARGEVEVLAEPTAYQPRANLRRRRKIEHEHARRVGDPSPGGVRGVPIVTAYRQEALACAVLLRAGPQPTKVLAGATPRATAIVYRNVYGWFARVGRGVYGLTAEGEAALVRWQPGV